MYPALATRPPVADISTPNLVREFASNKVASSQGHTEKGWHSRHRAVVIELRRRGVLD